MIRVAIVEDDLSCVQQLREYLSRYQKSSGEDIEVAVYPDGMAVVEQYRPVFDVLLLDIEMPRLDGMAAAREIRRTDPEVIMIFITNMARYAIKGYEVNALDFVLKPINYFAFSLKMDKVASILRSRRQECLVVSTEDGLVRLSTGEILYIEVISHRLHIHTLGETYVMAGTLADMERRLADVHFARCNKGYLVNLRNITRIKGNTVLVGRDELLISRRRRAEFLLSVTDYYGGGGQ